jgi:hypothetical protein
MFCYQKHFSLPTVLVAKTDFDQLVDSARTRWLTNRHRALKEALSSIEGGNVQLMEEWLSDDDFRMYCRKQESNSDRGAGGKTKGENFSALTPEKKLKSYCDYLKSSLPFVIFIATFDETLSVKNKPGCWRKQSACRLNGLCVIDFDHVEGDCREVWNRAWQQLPVQDQQRIMLVYVSPSGHGLKVVFAADAEAGNLIDNQKDFSLKLGLNPDESCIDASRGAFLTTREDILLLRDELFSFHNPAFGEKYDESYRAGKSSSTKKEPKEKKAVKKKEPKEKLASAEEQPAPSGVPDTKQYSKLLEAWDEVYFTGGDMSRHKASVVLARDLFILLDRDANRTSELLLTRPWVQAMIEERNEDVDRTVRNAADYVKSQEDENARNGKPWLPRVSENMQKAMEMCGMVSESTVSSQLSTVNSQLSTAGDDVYASLPLDKWGEELLKLADSYPCLKELFHNMHPYKLPAILFASAAMFGTLMTRTWYRFWYDPELKRRLNYCVIIIGDPGVGKNVFEKIYKKICDPMLQEDRRLIKVLNNYKDGRTERSTSIKAQNGDALKKPAVPIRVHPARTATGEFIKHMMAAEETVLGEPLNLHMFSFDAELDNVTTQNKSAEYKNREVLELKAFHNEQDGQMYANYESVTAIFNVYWNYVYTGTPYALHHKVNQRNFGSGLSTRLAVIPIPDFGVAQRNQPVLPEANKTLLTWAYRLDKVEGELPIEPLNDETYEWQTSLMEIADFNHDKADRTLLKRIPYYGIGISVPFILMKHWDEWEAHRTFSIDDQDRSLCRLAMEIQYRCQRFFFGEMAINYFEDQKKVFVQRRHTTRYDDCFRKLPTEFSTQQLMECFDCSQAAAWRSITRFVHDGVVKKIRYGKYRKLVQELP